jgi:hypothetical protein
MIQRHEMYDGGLQRVFDEAAQSQFYLLPVLQQQRAGT